MYLDIFRNIMANLVAILYLLILVRYSVVGLDINEILKNSQATKITEKAISNYINSSGDKNEKCVEKLKLFLENVDNNNSSDSESWALQMIDASAKMPSGIKNQYWNWLGRYDECLTIENLEAKVQGQYCLAMASFKENTSMEVVKHPFDRTYVWYNGVLDTKNFVVSNLGICIPDQCNQEDVKNALDTIIPAPWTVKCQTRDSIHEPFDLGAIITICYFSIFVVLIIMSTIYDVLTKDGERNLLLLSFSIKSNGKQLFSTKEGADKFPCLFGIRFLSIMWVLAGHSTSAQALVGSFSNNMELVKLGHKIPTMFFVNALNSVDTFFVVAGMLVVYSFMKKSQKGVKFNIVFHYVHRYLRLVPPIIPMLLSTIFLTKYVSSGPFKPDIDRVIVEPCRKYWWTTLLLIQNYYGNEYCLLQTWYLNVDWQLWVVSPIFLYLLSKWSKIGLGLMVCVITGSIVSSFLITWDMGIVSVTSSRFTNFPNFLSFYYTATHNRASTWLIGAILGYILAKINLEGENKSIKIPKWIIYLLWLIVLIVMPTCILAGKDRLLSEEAYHPYDHAFYNSFSRPAWGLCVAWVIFACITGNGGIINTFLSLPIFQILHRFVFSMFIVHLNIMHIIVMSQREPAYFTGFSFLLNLWGFFGLTLVVSAFWVLAFEFPIGRIEAYLKSNKSFKEEKETVTKC